MQVTLVADGRIESGGAAMVTHNERLADPLDSIVRKLSTLTKKRNKTEEDHIAIGALEWMGGLYTSPALEYDPKLDGFDPKLVAKATIGIPSWNVLRCLQDGAKRVKRGQDILRGCSPLTDFCPLIFDGPTDANALWQDGGFSLRKSVGVQRARTIRTRPIFTDWMLRLDIELDLNILDPHTLKSIWLGSGKYSGLCEMRPIFGRFAGTVELPQNAAQIQAEEEAAAAAMEPPKPVKAARKTASNGTTKTTRTRATAKA